MFIKRIIKSIKFIEPNSLAAFWLVGQLETTNFISTLSEPLYSQWVVFLCLKSNFFNWILLATIRLYPLDTIHPTNSTVTPVFSGKTKSDRLAPPATISGSALKQSEKIREKALIAGKLQWKGQKSFLVKSVCLWIKNFDEQAIGWLSLFGYFFECLLLIRFCAWKFFWRNRHHYRRIASFGQQLLTICWWWRFFRSGKKGSAVNFLLLFYRSFLPRDHYKDYHQTMNTNKGPINALRLMVSARRLYLTGSVRLILELKSQIAFLFYFCLILLHLFLNFLF